MATKKIHIQYFSMLKDEAGCTEEAIETHAKTPLQLYEDLKSKHNFSLSHKDLRVAINHAFEEWDYNLQSDDFVVFIPPVSGG